MEFLCLRHQKCQSTWSTFIFSLASPAAKHLNCSAGGHDNGNDHSVKSNSLSENENKDHSDEDGISLCVGSNSGISSNSDGKT
jgi:hypothetical protein